MTWKEDCLVVFAKNPELKTKRLLLRPMTLADLEDYHEYTSDEEVLKYDYPPHKDLAESETSLVVWNLAQPLGRYGIELTAEQKLIGNISLRPLENGLCEIGYTLNKAYWRQGHGSEAVEALCHFALGKLRAKKVIAQTDSRNQASRALLEKVGFVNVAEKASNSASVSLVRTTVVYELK